VNFTRVTFASAGLWVSLTAGPAVGCRTAATPLEPAVEQQAPTPSPVAAPSGAPPPMPEVMPARLLRTLAHDPQGYDPAHGGVSAELLLGDLLFHAPSTLGVQAQREGLSCHACHPNGATHATLVLDGVGGRPGSVDLSTDHFRVGADNNIDDAVDIPSLRGSRYTAPYGRDGRTASLAEFTRGVVVAEFGGALSEPKLAALVRYVNDLDFLPNRNLTKHGELSEHASASARAGEKHFNRARDGFAGLSCASCHPATSYFLDGRVHRLGSGDPASVYALDDGFETPTLLGTAETAPYFHDGQLATLADVVQWFDREYALGMSAVERAELTAYVEAVGAVEPDHDTRPLAQRLVETVVYLELTQAELTRDDRAVWAAAIEAVTRALAPLPTPAGLAERIAEQRARLQRLDEAVRAGDALGPLRPRARQLALDLNRLSADWAGALAGEGSEPGGPLVQP